MKRMIRLGIAAALCLRLLSAACPALGEAAEVSAYIGVISKYGNLGLSVTASELLSAGYAYGDIVTVTIAGEAYDMPIGSNYSDVDDGNMVCRAIMDENEGVDDVTLAINMGDLATAAGVATKTAVEEEPGYRWDYAGDPQELAKVIIRMKEAGGYAGEYHMRQLVRSNERADYPQLTDAQFANFRMVGTTGMGKNTLYRTSSPVNPEIGRSAYADAALSKAGVRTVINLADSEGAMKAYPGFAESAYARCSVIALNMGVDVHSEAFAEGFAQGMRFLIEGEAPYAIHCTEGKDRAGFVSAVLECLMGATAQEVVQDYMTTYENYYGVEPGSERYAHIAGSNISKTLAAVFGVEDIAADGVDLAKEAHAYFAGTLGLSETEIARVKACLSGEGK